MGNQFKSVALIACMKSLLMVFNIAFWVSGMLILGAGLWAEIDIQKYFEHSYEFSDTIPYVSIGIGCLSVFISSLACTCTIKGQPVLLYTYGGVLAIIFVMEVGVEISLYAYKHRISEALDRGMNVSFINYVNRGNGEKTVDFDFIQASFRCCGVNNYTDWLQLVPVRPIPLSCCKAPTNCITVSTSNIFIEGCYSIIVTFFENNHNWVLGVAAAISMFPLIGAMLSCCLANQIKKAKYDVIYDQFTIIRRQ